MKSALPQQEPLNRMIWPWPRGLVISSLKNFIQGVILRCPLPQGEYENTISMPLLLVMLLVEYLAGDHRIVITNP